MAFADRSQPQMLEHWQRLLAVIRATRTLLDNEIGFWAANGSSDERARWRWAWAIDPAPGIDARTFADFGANANINLGNGFPAAHLSPTRTSPPLGGA